MDTRYSNLPYMASYPAHSPQPRDQTPPSTDKEIEAATAGRESSFTRRIGAAWTLAAHCLLSVLLAVLILAYVADRHFNVSERAPLVKVVGGSRVVPFLPMQSDIVTFLSSILAVVKVALSAWMALLTWNAALLLMERRGLARRDLKILLNYGLLSPGAYSMDWSSLIIGSLFLASITANLASPILTGSISWIPSNRPVHGLPIDPVQIGDVENGAMTGLSPNYIAAPRVRDGYTSSAVGAAGIGWGRDVEKGVLKRVCDPVVGLSMNSTVENITLPFFQVHSIRWIEDPNEIPRIRDGAAPRDILNAQFNMTPTQVSGFPVGYVVLVPNVTTNWSSDPLELTTIHDTRLMMLLYGVDFLTGEHYTLTEDLPPSAFKQSYSDRYHAFAWVTFSAGVGYCKDYNCAVSSPSTIRNNAPIEVAPHQLTFQALTMAPVVAVHLVNLNNSIPYMWNSINDYVEAVLVRSYSGAWLSLSDNMQTISSSARYIPSLPSLLANIDRRRVYIWLGIQLLVTLLSILFLLVQSGLSKYPLLSDTSFIAFHLDTTAVASDNAVNETRKIEQRGSRLVVDLRQV